MADILFWLRFDHILRIFAVESRFPDWITNASLRNGRIHVIKKPAMPTTAASSPALQWESVSESRPDAAILQEASEQRPWEKIRLGPGEFPGIRRPFRSLWWLLQVVLGIGFLFPLLAGLAAIPGLSLVSLGMMLEAEADVGRSGRLRDGFPLLAVSTRVATMALMIFLFLLPVIGASSMASAQQVVTRLSGLPQSGWSTGTLVIQVIVFCFLLLSIANGGSFGRFFWPFRRRPGLKKGLFIAATILITLIISTVQPAFLVLYAAGWMIGVSWRNARDLYSGIRSGDYPAAVNYWTERLLQLFRPWHHFKIALKGAAGALCWLAVPTALLGTASTAPHATAGPAELVSLLGGILMIPVAAWLPLLQCHQAATGRFGAIFDVRTAREIICRVPLRWAVATILLYGLAIPLYLSKVVLPPADAFWLFTPLFILVIYPTRILMGWVYGTGVQQPRRRTRLIRWPTKVFMVPLLGLYSLILFVVPLISEAGPRAMFENHAFLLPVPSGEFEQN
ncbi:MAG: hypothetical protein RIK87_29760 [Fuerstiella sp.]